MGKKHKHHSHKNYESKVYGTWRKQPKEAFKLGKTGRPVWGGSFTTMQHHDWALLICCNGQSPSPLIYASPQALQLMPKLEVSAPNPFIRIDWEDLRTPEIRRSFWESLVAGLQKLGRPGPIGVCCTGGTGRTGTALAIMAQLSGAIPAGKCPVAFIRANYASDAIETTEQGKYISEVTGVDIHTMIEKPYLYSSHSNSVYKGGTSTSTDNELKCVHGIPMRLFCNQCMTQSGGINKYERTTAQ